MDNNKLNRIHDLNQSPDKTNYKVLFYVEQENRLKLYETLHLDSSPELPEEGDYVSFDFIVDEYEEEVFRKDEFIPESEIGSDRQYTHLSSGDLQIDRIETKYNKHVTKENKNMTTITKTVILTSNFDDLFKETDKEDDVETFDNYSTIE